MLNQGKFKLDDGCAFRIMAGKKEYVMKADSPEDCGEWAETIDNLIRWCMLLFSLENCF